MEGLKKFGWKFESNVQHLCLQCKIDSKIGQTHTTDSKDTYPTHTVNDSKLSNNSIQTSENKPVLKMFITELPEYNYLP